MKFLKIFVAVLMIFSFFAGDCFCFDHHHSDAQQHCVLTCHAACHSAIIPAVASTSYSFIVSSFAFTYTFSYQDPALETFKRPPVVVLS